VVARAQEVVDDELALLGGVELVVLEVSLPARLESLDVVVVELRLRHSHDFSYAVSTWNSQPMRR
jgi:hypothetical protein